MARTKILKAVTAALALLAAVPARGDWFEAQSDHFRLLIDKDEQHARDFAERLERFDGALRRLYGIADDPDLHNRPVTIYALDLEQFNYVCRCGNILGYYNGAVEGPHIMVLHEPTADRKMKLGDLSSQTLLLHEYSHHFMLTNFPGVYPRWYIEGFAEFNANVVFETDGAVKLGYPANYRGNALLGGTRLPLRQLIAPEIYGSGGNEDLFYGRAWALTHYLMLNRARNGQLDRYLTTIRAGKPSIEAAQTAFGDFAKLDREIDAYQTGTLSQPLRIAPMAKPPTVRVRQLSEGEAAVLRPWLTMMDGLPGGYKGVAMDAERAARRFPDDLTAQLHAAEANLLATRLPQAQERIDRALEIAPQSGEALLLKGRITTAQAHEARPTDVTAWAAGRAWFRKANRAMPQAVEPFYRYYVSFAWANIAPPADAVRGLMRATVLAPESDRVTLALARQRLREGDGPAARALLVPLGAAPHTKRGNEGMAALIALIDAGKLAEATTALATMDRPWA